jgi:Ala-tRNA(Pro) deacylase
MPIPQWILSHLEARGVPYRVHHHRTTHTAEATARREHVSGVEFGKVVVAIADGKAVLLVIPEYARVDLMRTSATLGAHDLRLAREDEMASLLPDAEVGAVPPLRHWAGVEIWMDPLVRHAGDFVVQAGTHQDAVRLAFADWVRIAEPRVGGLVVPTFIGA